MTHLDCGCPPYRRCRQHSGRASHSLSLVAPDTARHLVCAALVAAVVSGLSTLLTAAPDAVDVALNRFLEASSPADAAKAADAVTKAGASFDDVYAALKKGRQYKGNAPKGIVTRSHFLNGMEFPYTLDVPLNYDASRKYQLRVQLHGGVGRPDAAPRGNGIGPLAGVEQIYLLPTAWSDAEWWTDAQLENLRSLIDTVKRTYNIDENRIVLSGVSDGGTGTYYFSMRGTTPFAAFLPLNGAIAVLRNTSMRIDGELFMNNMKDKPFFIVNGGKDPLYPTSTVEPYIRQMQRTGVTLQYLPQPDGVHNTAWWPDVKDTYEAFVREHPRVPLPDSLTWESDLRAAAGRAHWLVIDALAPQRKDAAPLPDVNDVLGPAVPDFGVRVVGTTIRSVAAGSNADSFGLVPGDVVEKLGPRAVPSGLDVTDLLDLVAPGTPVTLTVKRGNDTVDLKGTYNPVIAPSRTPFFTHVRPSGRVDLSREGNTITATTRRVAAFTLLLSPDQFDLSRPITVVADGKTIFEGTIRKDPATLLKWAAVDNDRTMLFAAELTLKLE
jgi:poly(3-hydroxybutyrate) depolymerase